LKADLPTTASFHRQLQPNERNGTAWLSEIRSRVDLMELDPLLISRLQFAFTIIFHIIFPTFTIGLSAYIATLCIKWMRTGKEHYRALAQFWTKIFAVLFDLGVCLGHVITSMFGTKYSSL